MLKVNNISLVYFPIYLCMYLRSSCCHLQLRKFRHHYRLCPCFNCIQLVMHRPKYCIGENFNWNYNSLIMQILLCMFSMCRELGFSGQTKHNTKYTTCCSPFYYIFVINIFFQLFVFAYRQFIVCVCKGNFNFCHFII